MLYLDNFCFLITVVCLCITVTFKIILKQEIPKKICKIFFSLYFVPFCVIWNMNLKIVVRNVAAADLYKHNANIISMNSEVNIEAGVRFRPPSGFTDSREFSEAECDRDRALDLEVQQVMENNDLRKIERDELTSLLAR